jgi:hypothetical protein
MAPEIRAPIDFPGATFDAARNADEPTTTAARFDRLTIVTFP